MNKFKIWKTIEIGGKPDLTGINISHYAQVMLDKIIFQKEKENIDLVKITPRELGFEDYTTTKDIYAEAQELGLELCPPDVGPHLRMQYQNQPSEEWLHIGMEPITDSDGYSSVFHLARSEGGLWLGDIWAKPDGAWHPDRKFVFRLRKQLNTVADRILGRTVKTKKCWEWQGGKSYGYGRIKDNNTTLTVHRVIYEALVGIIPSGMVLDHLCKNKVCVNPEHLEPVSIGENVLRGDGPTAINARKTHCTRGHKLIEGNLSPSTQGKRICKKCKKSSYEE